ncbi:hypothetical protein QOZ80_8BG0641810 [Eleusine coracana subsp. coracana]|nr:hypothetical protein QOZ80_8BG0641810 [Eleusine coracana subsp. coracana]
MGKTSSLLCCPCRCLVCGFASCMLTVLACIFVAGGLAALTLYLVFRPHVIQAAVDFADLHTFRLEPRTWILRYNLTLDVHLRNPNKRIAFHYTHVNAQAFYQDQRFASSSSSGDKMHDFFQDAGETCVLYPAFLGQFPLVGGVAAAGFRREAAENATFSIDVRIHAHMKLKVWFLSVPGPSPKIECPLRIRRRKRDTGELRPGSFYPTKCIVWF